MINRKIFCKSGPCSLLSQWRTFAMADPCYGGLIQKNTLLTTSISAVTWQNAVEQSAEQTESLFFIFHDKQQ